MLLYTDGGDTRSAMSYRDLVDLLKASDVTVYAVGAVERRPPSVRLQQRKILQEIAGVTGGQAFFPIGTSALGTIYEQILAEIRAQFTIGYVSTNEKYEIEWQLSSDADFGTAGNIRCASVLKLGDSSVNGSGADSAAGRYFLMVSNEFAGTVYRYARLFTRVAGTIDTSGINYSAFLASL